MQAQCYWLYINIVIPHNSALSLRKTEELGFTRMLQPPYSHDLTPCAFLLFGYLKKELQGMNFGLYNEMLSAMTAILSEIPARRLSRVCGHRSRDCTCALQMLRSLFRSISVSWSIICIRSRSRICRQNEALFIREDSKIPLIPPGRPLRSHRQRNFKYCAIKLTFFYIFVSWPRRVGFMGRFNYVTISLFRRLEMNLFSSAWGNPSRKNKKRILRAGSHWIREKQEIFPFSGIFNLLLSFFEKWNQMLEGVPRGINITATDENETKLNMQMFRLSIVMAFVQGN
jgi:hypothetical protein